jgi:hypothetical protein
VELNAAYGQELLGIDTWLLCTSLNHEGGDKPFYPKYQQIMFHCPRKESDFNVDSSNMQLDRHVLLIVY